MSKPTGYHVRHDLKPIFAYELLMLLRGNHEQTEDELKQVAHSQGFNLRQRKNYGKLLRSLEELNIVNRESKSISLTETGRIISEATLLQRDLLAELIHYQYYTLYETNDNLRFSWSYRTVCDHLWMTAPCTINRDRLVNIVVEAATEHFDETSISFSTQSVMGILYWVESVSPSCIEDGGKTFSRRLYCPVETFALALNHIYQRHRGDVLSILLTPEVKDEVCQLCLIVPEAFDEMLEQAEMSFSKIQFHRERGERLIVNDFNWNFLKE
jgi:hypothetical protein